MQDPIIKKETDKTDQFPQQISEKGNSNKPEVIIIRNWKEYLGESLLIVFSVGLALILTELINKENEKRQIRELISNVHEELIHNKNEEIKQYNYHLGVLKNIDSALDHSAFANQVINNNEFHIELIAPHGVLYGDLEDVAWQLAKSHNISSSLDIQTLSLLTSIYNDQQKIIKVEDEIGKIILSPDSRKPQNIRLTLLLIRDNYRGWATYRVPDLMEKYQAAINKLSSIN